MNVTINHPNSSFTGTITVLETVAVGFTNGVASVDIPPQAIAVFGSMSGFSYYYGAPGPAPAYDANLDVSVNAIVGNGSSASAGTLRAAYGHSVADRPVADTATIIGPYWVTDQPGTSRSSHTSGGAVGDLRLVYGNWVTNAGNGDTDASNGGAIPIRAAVEYPAGTITPVFFTGQRDGNLGNGATLTTDPVGVNIPPNTQFWVRTYLNVPSGYKWPQVVNSSGNTLGEGFAAGDLTAAGSASIARSDSYLFAPIAILGRSSATRAVALVGDSIMAGQGDVNDMSIVNGTAGFGSRALTSAGITWASIALPGEKADTFINAPTGSIRRLPIISNCTSAVCDYGANDLQPGSSQPYATLTANLVLLWRALAVRGMRVWQTTITPNTNSTDNWATVANQTVDTYRSNPIRVQLNDWIRAGAPLDPTALTPVAVGTSGALLAGQSGHWLTGYFDTADAVETSRNSGIWKATGRAVTDGAITTGTATLTSATAAFASGDVGKSVFVKGAGASAGDLATTISSVTNATTAVLAANAGTTVSGATVGIGTNGYTVDGTHPSPSGHAAMATAIDVTKLT
jgi:hypothetical protein